MIYSVVWTRNAENQLARLWTAAVDRNRISSAADAIDRALRRDASNCGESRSGDRRIVHEAPLGAMFRVLEADRKVIVLDVWRYSKPAAQ